MRDQPASAPLLISILNWNGTADTLRCLAGLAPPGDGLWRVLVIDNGSASDPGPEIVARFPWVEYVRLATNAGFAAGQNHGLRLAMQRGQDAVLLLNNDCDIGEAAIRALLEQLCSHAAMAAVSPLLYCSGERTRPQMVAAWLDWAGHRSVRPSQPQAAPAGMPVMVPGTALMLSCAALKRIGLLDERYFAYYEDNDLSARIAAHGLSASYCPQARAWHASRPVRQYSDMALYLSARNAWLFWRAHTPQPFRRGMARHLLAESLAEIAHLQRAGEAAKCLAVVAGFWDGLRRRSGPPPARMASPLWLRWPMCRMPFLLYQLLTDPARALVTRLWRRRRPGSDAV